MCACVSVQRLCYGRSADSDHYLANVITGKAYFYWGIKERLNSTTRKLQLSSFKNS